MEKIITDERRPGIELLELQGEPGYHTEHICVSNSLLNGLRIEIFDEGEEGEEGSDGWWCFHIRNPETARLIAAKLLEWSERIL